MHYFSTFDTLSIYWLQAKQLRFYDFKTFDWTNKCDILSPSFVIIKYIDIIWTYMDTPMYFKSVTQESNIKIGDNFHWKKTDCTWKWISHHKSTILQLFKTIPYSQQGWLTVASIYLDHIVHPAPIKCHHVEHQDP